MDAPAQPPTASAVKKRKNKNKKKKQRRLGSSEDLAGPPSSAPQAAPNAWMRVQPPLLPSTLATVAKLGFTTMTPVQSATIPLFRQNKDVCVEVS